MNRAHFVSMLGVSFLFAAATVFGSESGLKITNNLSENIRILYWNNKSLSNEELCIEPNSMKVLDEPFAKNVIWVKANGWERKYELQDQYGIINTAPITITALPTIEQERKRMICFGDKKTK